MFNAQRHGYVDLQDLFLDLVSDLTSNGFDRIYPDPLTYTELNASDTTVVLEATNAVDPLVSDPVSPQPWRLKISIDNGVFLNFYAACAQQINDQGEHTMHNDTWAAGHMAHDTDINKTFFTDTIGFPDETNQIGLSYWDKPEYETYWKPHFHHRFFRYSRYTDSFYGNYDRTNPNWRSTVSTSAYDYNHIQFEEPLENPAAHTLTYLLTVGDHGVMFALWDESATHTNDHYNWFVIQSPVDSETGQVLTTGKAPLFCVYGIGELRINVLKRFVVREADVECPDHPVDAIQPSTDHHAIINPAKQVAITENEKYIINFPNNLNTKRFMYLHELDMIGYTSADILGHSAEVNLNMYGETTTRTYKALNANVGWNAGMRILGLVDNS